MFARYRPVVAAVGSQAVVTSLVGLATGPRPHGGGLGVGQEDHLDATQRAAGLGNGSLDGVKGELRPPAASGHDGDSAKEQHGKLKTIAGHCNPLSQKLDSSITE